MRVLFIGLKVGAGLISICQSVKNELEKTEGVETDYVDIYSENEKMAKFSSEFYYKLVKLFPRLVAFGQKFAYNKSLKSKEKHGFINNDVKVCKEEVLKFINRYKPDVIYTPMNFVAIALDKLIVEGKTNVKYVYQVPDFMLAYYVQLIRHCSFLVSSCEEITNLLVEHGFDKEKIRTFGIPINPKFHQKVDRAQVLKKMNFPDKKFILISNGGAGFANNCKIVKHFYDKIVDYYLIVVNGKNKASESEINSFIKENNIKNVINLGFVDNMNELMAISDIMIGKCGSSTLCEASINHLKYIALDNNLFPEIKNIEFLKNRQASIVVKNTKEMSEALKLCISGSDKIKAIEKNFSKINIENSTEKIAQLILSLEENKN